MEEKFSILKPNLAANYLGIMLATVIALRKLDGKGTNAQIAKIIIETHDIDEETQKLLVPDGTETLLNLYFSWARTYLRISGDLKNVSRGVWELTESGRKIYNLEDSKQALKKYNEKEAQKKLGILPTTDEASDEINSNDSERDSEPSKKRNFIIKPDETPDISGIMLAIIIALGKIDGLGTIHEINARVIKDEEIEEAEQSYPLTADGNRPKLDYYLSWARTYLKIIGALENPARGIWKLTESGFAIVDLPEAQKSFDRCVENIGQQTESTRKSLNALQYKEQPDEANNPDDEAWKFDLLSVLQKMDGYAFERLCKILLDAVGFKNVTLNPKKGADGGIDGIGFLRVNLISFKVCIQCKRQKRKVSVDKIRDFRGALAGRTDKGLFFTTSTFTSHAKDEAVRYGMILIDLIDGYDICDLLKDNKLGVETSPDGQTITIDSRWFDNI